jgi:hypothetical protein
LFAKDLDITSTSIFRIFALVLKRIFTYYLIVSFAMGAIGINLVEHTCHLFAITEYSLSKVDACCELPESEGEILDFKCCSIDHHSFAIDVESTMESEEIALDIPLDAVAEIIPLEFSFVEQVENTLNRNNSPPTLKSSVRRNLLQVYRL